MFKRFTVLVAVVMMIMVNTVNVFAITREDFEDAHKECDEMEKEMEENSNVKDCYINCFYIDEDSYGITIKWYMQDDNVFELYMDTDNDGDDVRCTTIVNGNVFKGNRKACEICDYISYKYDLGGFSI